MKLPISKETVVYHLLTSQIISLISDVILPLVVLSIILLLIK